MIVLELSKDYAERRRINGKIRSLFTAVVMAVVALVAVLGFNSMNAFAADNVTSITPDSPKETVLVSSATGPVAQEVSQQDYDKLNPQYKVTPDGNPTIQSKT